MLSPVTDIKNTLSSDRNALYDNDISIFVVS